MHAIDCDNCPEHRVNLFAGLDPAVHEEVRARFNLMDLVGDETIYRRGERGKWIYVVRFGIIKLLMTLPDGEERIVRLATQGDTIGLEVLVGDPTYNQTAVAITPANLCRIPADMVDRRLQESAQFARRLMSEWQASLDEADTFITELSTGRSDERMARLLLFLHRRCGKGCCSRLGREDMGELLGITTETASRTIAEFRRRGLLVDDDHGGWVCDPAHLEALLAN